MKTTVLNIGIAAELEVAGHLIKNGWYVYKCLNGNSPSDLIVEKNGVIKRVDVTTNKSRFKDKIRNRLNTHCDTVALWDGHALHCYPKLEERKLSMKKTGLPQLSSDIVLKPMPDDFNPSNNGGSYMIDRNLLNKRYQRKSGTKDRMVFWRISRLLDAVVHSGHKQLQSDLLEKRVSPMELYDLYRHLWDDPLTV